MKQHTAFLSFCLMILLQFSIQAGASAQTDYTTCIQNAVENPDPSWVTVFTTAIVAEFPETESGIIYTQKTVYVDAMGMETIGFEATNKPEPRKGWVLYNDGCFYHGTFDTINGVEVFIADPRPWHDNYVGNEPRCLLDHVIDEIC